MYIFITFSPLKEREKEKELREEEMLLLQRMKEAEMFKEWESQEDEVCIVIAKSTV